MTSPAREIATPVEQEPDTRYNCTTVGLDERNPGEVKKYYCHACGHVVFRYYTHIKVQTPGRPGFSANIVEIQCGSRIERVGDDGQPYRTFCKQRYYLTH